MVPEPLLLPLSSRAPMAACDPDAEPDAARAAIAIDLATAEAEALRDRLVSEVVPAASLRHSMSIVRERLADVDSLCRGRLEPLWASDGPPAASRAARPAELDEAYAAYDSYFRLRRVPALGAAEFAAQTVHTLRAVVADLLGAVIALDEIVAILNAGLGMLRWCRSAARAAPAGGTRPPAEGVHGPVRDSVEVARRRWTTGHHLFNLCAVFCVTEIEAAASAPAPALTATLRRVTTYLRATTAAMWYASNFPAAVYLDHIRPSMAVQAGRQVGFSGTQNLDYQRLGQALDRLRPRFVERLGDPGAWPADVHSAMCALWEVEIEHAENHVAIAASKVALSPSLLQERVRRGHSPAGAGAAAVDVLRDLAARRRRAGAEFTRR